MTTENSRPFLIPIGRLTVAFRSASLGLLFFLALGFSGEVFAQDDPTYYAPPPAKLMSKTEKERLDDEKDIRNKTKLSLELIENRIASAERLSQSEDYIAMFKEMGAIQALMENCMNFISRSAQNDRAFDSYKRLEIGLRKLAPRLENIRRDLPPRYENYVEKLIKQVRDTRAKAADGQFADSVVPDQ